MLKLKNNEKLPYDKEHKVIALHLVITIVPQGMGDAMMYLFMKHSVSAQFIMRGEGTASKDILDVMGMDDNNKEIIYSLVTDLRIEEVMKELSDFFHSSKKRPGIAFSVPLSAIAGRTAYHFLTQTIE